MTAFKTLPLGVDLGSSRVRVGLIERSSLGEVALSAVVSRDLPDDAASSEAVAQPELVASVIDELREELGTRERRCVIAIGVPAAALRVMRFPRMSWTERTRAAQFEAGHFATWDAEEEPSLVRVHAAERRDGRWAVGIVKQRVLQSRVAAVRAAGLRVVAVDHDAYALRRALEFCDAIVDVGQQRSVVHAFGDGGPQSWVLPGGGVEITRGIARELAIDLPTAERRKRILGSAGAGGAARDELVAQIAAAVDRARARVPISRIALTGNGARLPGLANEIEAATAAIVELPVSNVLRSGAYPDDVVRAAAPDWTLAAGLALWSHAA